MLLISLQVTANNRILSLLMILDCLSPFHLDYYLQAFESIPYSHVQMTSMQTLFPPTT